VPADPDAQQWQLAFGDRIRQLRDERMLSQEQLAHLAGIHPTYLSGVERGKRNLSLVNIQRLARALDVAPSALF
jgi:transcriptional regulator with XRE-family HTH domain